MAKLTNSGSLFLKDLMEECLAEVSVLAHSRSEDTVRSYKVSIASEGLVENVCV